VLWVADTGSRVGEGRNRKEDGSDGSGWDVSEDWENMSGLVNDIMLVKSEKSALAEQFTKEPLFMEVIKVLTIMDEGTDSKAVAKAKHQASEYFIEKEKLWHKGWVKEKSKNKVGVCNKRRGNRDGEDRTQKEGTGAEIP
jgi:hypothetical protein